ncbi:MAG: alginate O-acetyltransferase AlgX-related protein [Bacteroidia bacterium]
MNWTGKTYPVILLLIFLGIFCLPKIQENFRIVDVNPLLGAYDEPPSDIQYNFNNWLKGNFQEQKEKFINNSFGLRNIFIRIHNQFEYSLFNKANAKDVIVGKDNYLFDDRYIFGYYGTDYIGIDTIRAMMNRLEFINDTLKKLNKTLILIFAPNKADFYSEYIPDRYKVPIQNTNYGSYLKLIKESGIDYIDFNSYFISQKQKSKYPLIPKNGTHWSMYGAALAGDSLVKYIEKTRHIIMPSLIWKSIKVRTDTLFDIDIENSMNLLFNLQSPLMAYPELKFGNDSAKTKPNVLVEGDSYYWGWQNECFNIRDGLSASSDFWYYFKKLEHKEVSQSELRDAIAGKDVIIILSTTHNWSGIGSGFIESMYNMFKGVKTVTKTNPDYAKRLNDIRASIKSNRDWLAQIEKQANKNGISVDSCITVNAMWVIEHEHNK